jgi:hypothetical protein
VAAGLPPVRRAPPASADHKDRDFVVARAVLARAVFLALWGIIVFPRRQELRFAKKLRFAKNFVLHGHEYERGGLMPRGIA